MITCLLSIEVVMKRSPWSKWLISASKWQITVTEHNLKIETISKRIYEKRYKEVSASVKQSKSWSGNKWLNDLIVSKGLGVIDVWMILKKGSSFFAKPFCM